jgi:hypothetical protein
VQFIDGYYTFQYGQHLIGISESQSRLLRQASPDSRRGGPEDGFLGGGVELALMYSIY